MVHPPSTPPISQRRADAPSDAPLYDPYLVPAGANPLPHSGSTPPAHERRRQRLTLFVAIASMLTTLSAVGVAGWGLYHWRHLLLSPNAQDGGDEDATTKQTGLPTDATQDAERDDADDSDDAAKAPAVPDDTKVKQRGRIEVVDIGLSATRLESALQAQSELARAKGQILVVMTSGSDCGPCRGVEASLDDPLMQHALAGVRLVRVELKVFKEEVAELKMPTNLYPAFFLLGPDMIPRDGVHGGEWDEDVAKNIAPVLGAFVRGEYKKRRHQDWSPTTGSIAL